jgi:hypothetical protein
VGKALGIVTRVLRQGVVCAALATACENPEPQRSPVSRAPPTAAAPTPPDASAPDAQLLAIQTASAAAATFEGNDLRNCVEVAVTVTRAKHYPYNPTDNVTAEQMAILMLDDALTAFADPKIKFAYGSWETTTQGMLVLAAGRPTQADNGEWAKNVQGTQARGSLAA